LLEVDRTEQGMTHATKQIVQSAARLGRVVDDLADVAGLQASAIAIKPTLIRLQDTILAAAEASGPFIERRHQSLHVDVALIPPLWISGDDVRLQQVLANLLSNASKYSPEGGNISISSREEHGRAVVVVRDTGIGIRRDMLQRIFEPFVRESPISAEGLGVGLTLARDLVTQHGGHISAHSDGLGRGSSFVIDLPLVSQPEMVVN